MATDKFEWNCPVCTYLNINTSKCKICQNNKPVMNNAEWSCSICTFKNQQSKLLCAMCQQGTRSKGYKIKTSLKQRLPPISYDMYYKNSIITVGDQVTLCNCEWDGIYGIVYCIIKLDADEKYGVRLLQKRSVHNGWYKSVEYFKCDPGYGAFVTKKQIKSIDDVKININRITLSTKVYVKRPSKCIGSIIYIGPKTNKLGANTYKKNFEYMFGRGYLHGVQKKKSNAFSDHGSVSTINSSKFKKELDDMYYGVLLDKRGLKAKVFVQRHDLEYPISAQHQVVDVNQSKMVEEIKADIYEVSTVYDCFKITDIEKKDNGKIIKIFVTENAKHCIVVTEYEKDYKKIVSNKSSVIPPLPPMLKQQYKQVLYIYRVDLYKLTNNTFKLMASEENIGSTIDENYSMTDVVFDEHNCRLLLNIRQSRLYCVDIEMNDDIYKIKTQDVSEYFNFDKQITFVSFLNDGKVILSVFSNGFVVTTDSLSFQVLNKFNVARFYPKYGPKTDKIERKHQADPWTQPTYSYHSKIRKQCMKILTVALNEDKNCIAWIEREYGIMYYLQIYSLKLITTPHETDSINYKQYLITSRLIAQKTTLNSGILYESWYREEFGKLMKNRAQQWGASGTVESSMKQGNTKYVVETLAAINDKTVKLMFNDNADKLLYCSIDNMSNDLLVIDRNTMTTLHVTCKGNPCGWIFKDYLIVSQIGGKNQKKFTTLDIQGFISETSIAELLCEHALKHINFPWVLCLEIAVFVGYSREFRDVTLVNYTMENDEKIVKFNNILLELKPCDMVWNVGHYVVIMLQHSNEIIFYDSRCIKFKDEDTMVTYTEKHGIIARNNNKNFRTFRKLWIDQSHGF